MIEKNVISLNGRQNRIGVLHKETFSAEKSEKRQKDSWEGEEEENEEYETKRMLSRETTRDGPYYWRDQTAVGVLTARAVERRTKRRERVEFNAAD